MKITAIGFDLAKSVFQVHGVDEDGHVIVKKKLRRAQVSVFFANVAPCLVGIEACSSAHHWARKLQAFGHTVRLMELLQRLLENARQLRIQAEEIETEIKRWHENNEQSRRLAEIPGIGALTASALVASIGDAKAFANGRQLAGWIGLVPRQYSSGGKAKLLGISKRGDKYLRTLMVHGARSVILRARAKAGYAESWLGRLLARRHKNVAACALANRSARVVWALLAHNRHYQSSYARAEAA